MDVESKEVQCSARVNVDVGKESQLQCLNSRTVGRRAADAKAGEAKKKPRRINLLAQGAVSGTGVVRK